MVNPQLVLRPAIAMIELIFALVIMGIALLSAPLIMDMSIQSSTTAIQQESVAAASSKLSLILTKAWDEQTATPPNIGILDPATEAARLQPANRMTRTTNPRCMRDYIYTPAGATIPATTEANFAPANPADSGNMNDIDDFNSEVTQLTLYNAANETSNLALNEGEYIHGRGFDLTTIVRYGNDAIANYGVNAINFNNPFAPLAAAPGALSSNIKLITVRLTPNNINLTSNQSEFANENVTLRAFSCNIGNGGLTFSPTEIVGAP